MQRDWLLTVPATGVPRDRINRRSGGQTIHWPISSGRHLSLTEGTKHCRLARLDLIVHHDRRATHHLSLHNFKTRSLFLLQQQHRRPVVGRGEYVPELWRGRWHYLKVYKRATKVALAPPSCGLTAAAPWHPRWMRNPWLTATKHRHIARTPHV